MGGFQGLGDWYHHPEKNKNSMCYDVKEYQKKYQKEWYIKNKEKVNQKGMEWRKNNKDYMKEYNKNNKEKYKQRYKEYYEKNKGKKKEYHKEYYQTSECKKSQTISCWKRSGLKLFGYTYDEVYEYYLSIDNCEVCNKDISKSSHQKNMDHCHSTGIFRWVLCKSCNNKDNWMNKI